MVMLPAMANKERARDRGVRRGVQMLGELGREAREARIAVGLTQSSVARAVGIDRSWISRFERGDSQGIGLVTISTILAVVGLDLGARAWPGGDSIRDAASQRLLGRFHLELHGSIGRQGEVPLPSPGDLRSWDELLRIGTQRWGTEAETRVGDVQARTRSLQLKRRDGRVDGVILLLADTAHHRALLRAHGPMLRSVCPVPGAEALAALREGRPPSGDAIILL